jgi:hypothetical protein
MAKSSKYIQLSSSVLMEYVYSDQSQINVPGNEFRIDTTTAPIWKMNNAHNGQPQILNSDGSEIVQDGLPIGTGNVRNRSFAIIEPYKVGLLDIDKLVYYNDYDPALTPTPNLPVNFTNQQAPVYDTIRLHLVQGFNFEENEALLLSLKAKRKDGSTFVLCNLVYNREDVWETLNPSPFFFGGRIYTSYLEVRILSLYNLIYDYWLGVLTGDTVVERITDFNGVQRNQLISTFFSWVNKRETIDGQTYLTLTGTKTIDLPVRDQFETIGAYISESQSGDFVEYYATYNGNIIENYILDLNSSGGDYSIIHDLNLFEYVYDPSTATYSWVKTDEMQTYQNDGFDQPQYFRPIIRNTNTVAYKLDYTCRLYNKVDNSQVWKNASMISQSAAKYGRYLKSINLGSNPVQTKIYNQKIVKDISINRVTEPVVNNVRYITSFTNNQNISVTSETVNPSSSGSSSSTLVQTPSTLQNSGTSSLQLFENGLGRILIPKSAVFLKFTIFQKVNGQNKKMNLSGLGDMYLVFNASTNDTVEFLEFPNPYTSKTSGEVVFRLSGNEATKILGLSDRSFQIFLQNESKDRTFLYAGEFFNTSEFQKLAKENRVAKLETQVTDLSRQISDLTVLSNNQQQTIQNITGTNTQLQKSLTEAVQAAAASDEDAALDTIQSQSKMIDDLNNQVQDLTGTVKSLMESLELTSKALAESNGLLSNTSSDTPTNTESGTASNKKLIRAQANIKINPASNQSS